MTPHRSSLPPAYITAAGAFLPGPPITNDRIEEVLGLCAAGSSRFKEKVLAANGIRSRHYALDADGATTMLNEELAARAIGLALADRGIGPADVGMLAVGTTQPDLLVPGFASMVHGRLGGGPMETLSAAGVCCSSMAAFRAAALAVAAGEHRVAVACGSELVSRSLKASRFDGSRPGFDAEFLRWMLSDGAGAVVIEHEPRPDGLSLRIEWTHLVSHAHAHPTCMSAGASGTSGPGEAVAGSTWLDQPTVAAAEAAGMLQLRQDTSVLGDMVAFGVDEYARLVKDGRIEHDRVAHVLCHLSSEWFRGRITGALAEHGLDIPAEKWFTNLDSKGNTGAASIFIMLEEALHTGRIGSGDQVLLMVPESGRFTVAFALLTCVAPDGTGSAGVGPAGGGGLPVLARLAAELGAVWVDFERSLDDVPVVKRLESGQATMADYQRLLVNLRQQVVEGARWIARAASSVSPQEIELRSLLIAHAQDEHRDFELLEADYVALGGERADIVGAPKNIGTEALSAWMMHQASQPDPLDLLGAMFIIEGLGARMAGPWASRLAAQLHLGNDQVRFFRYHATADSGTHLARFERILASGLIDDMVADRIVKTAKVTARLYRLQLEELDHV
jgi:3-oxoacyl-[acyl-carrier-protein] synthase-3